MSIGEKAVNPVIEPIPGKLFVVGRVPGGEWKLPDKKYAKRQSNEQGREQVLVEELGQDHFGRRW